MRLFYTAIVLIAIASCSGKNSKPDVSDIKVNVSISRFEQAFFTIDTNDVATGLARVNASFPRFTPFYLEQVLRVSPQSPDLKQIIATYRPINDSIQAKYKDLSWLKSGVEEAFRYVRYYYPQYKLPELITFIGTFDSPGVLLTRDYLGIGLHQFAGKNFSVYQDNQLREIYPQYISRRFDKEYILPACIKAVADDIYADSSTGRPLIEQMIEKGKQWYLVDKFYPEGADSLKTGFTKKQLDWLSKNEGNVWGYITTNVDIYTIDPLIVQDYIGEGPFTRGMPEGFAPGNIGQWVGWKIVSRFADSKKLSLQEVLATPPQTIFQEAKYKPK